MAFGGAKEKLEFVLDLNSRAAQQALSQFSNAAERDLGKVDDRMDRLGTRMQTVGAGMVGFAGVAGTALFGFAMASEEANLSVVKLQNSIDRSPALVGETTERFTDLADAIQSVTAADGDQIVAAEAMLGTFRLTGDEIEAITPLVVDYARKFEVDLVTAATQVGKALSGNLATLQRNGVLIDEAAFATDRFSAVTDALRENVGGFAEAEGRTFAGSLQRMKNELGDVAEGIGAGVIPAVQNLLGPVIAVSDALGRVSPNTQAAVGSLATYATAAIGVAGATSLVAGSVVKARANFAGLNSMLGLSAVAVGRMRIAVGLLGLAFAGIAVADVLNDMNGAVSDLAGATDEAVLAAMRGAQEFGILNEYFAELAATAPGTAQRMYDLAEASGVSSADLAMMQVELDKVAASAVRLAEDEERAALAVREMSGEVEDFSAEAAQAAAILDSIDAAVNQIGTDTATAELESIVETVDEVAEAVERLDEAEQERYRNIRGQFDTGIALENAMLDTKDALDAAYEAWRDFGSGSEEAMRAYNAAEEAAMAQADAAVAAAEERNGDLQLTSEETARIQIESIRSVADNLAPDSEIRQNLEALANQLENEIPKEISTDINADSSDAVTKIEDVKRRLLELQAIVALVQIRAGVGAVAPVDYSTGARAPSTPGPSTSGPKGYAGVTVVNNNYGTPEELQQQVERRTLTALIGAQ